MAAVDKTAGELGEANLPAAPGQGGNDGGAGPTNQFQGRDFISLADYSSEELQFIIQFARRLKQQQADRQPHPLLAGKTLAMIFAKPSTRTRVSFEVGMAQLGGRALYLNAQTELQLGRGETIADTARVLSRYVDGIMIRTYAHEEATELAKYAAVPVINGLTNLLHPCQALADFLTLTEKKGDLAGLQLAYVGDGNNMVHSLMLGAAKLGVTLRVATPQGYEPDGEIVALAREIAGDAQAVTIGHDPVAAVTGADAIYTDVWAGMGAEDEALQREQDFKDYQVDTQLVSHAAADAVFMHCLPAQRGLEVTDAVMDGPHSIVFDQAENRLHLQKAVLALLLS